MKFEFEINDEIADEILRRKLLSALAYAVNDMQLPSTHEEDREYYRGLIDALDIVLDYYGEND